MKQRTKKELLDIYNPVALGDMISKDKALNSYYSTVFVS